MHVVTNSFYSKLRAEKREALINSLSRLAYQLLCACASNSTYR